MTKQEAKKKMDAMLTDIRLHGAWISNSEVLAVIDEIDECCSNGGECQPAIAESMTLCMICLDPGCSGHYEDKKDG